MNRTFLKTTLVALVLSFYALSGLAQDQQDKDWPKYHRYAEKNKEVKGKPTAVLFGDSITQNWAKYDQQWLDEHNFVGRGIGGQTTMHLLSRIRQDVIELHPRYMVLLIGINDIARNNGYIKVENIFKNIVSIVELAKLNKIKPVMCTVLPAREIGWRQRVGDPRPSIDSLNILIKDYAKANRIPLVDYHSAMAMEDGGMNPAFETDAVHPNLDGYKVMEEELLKVLKVK